MKRRLSILLAAALLLSFTGCRQEDSADTLSQTNTAGNTSPSQHTGSTAGLVLDPDLPEPEDTDLVRVIDYIPGIRQELAYASVNNFSGQRIYDFTDAYLRYGTVKKLALVCQELAQQGLGLKIWDGFRPVSAQAALWEICPDETYVSHPVTGNRSHCRGSAVDVTLVDLETGEDLAVPTGFDHFTVYADRDYSDCSPEAARNAQLLEQTMEKHGFSPYFAEWWHFADTDEYPVDEAFDPAVPAIWSANCEEYISLRPSAGSSEVITRIPKGETMQLLSWTGKYAQVSYGGSDGYVLASYIMPQEERYLEQCLDTVAPADNYSYTQMCSDIAALQASYPELVTTAVIGSSELGADIPVLRIGSLNAKYHILLHGAIHGREHMTAWLLMAMADYWLDHDILSYGDVCYHIIPMINPDGVAVSQSGALDQSQQEIYRTDTRQGYTTADESAYASLWKANGLGVDLNRNFPTGWETIDDRSAPSAQRYQGDAPFSAAEACALRDYTLRYAFDATVSYHASGSVIYYEYGQRQPVNTLSESLGHAVETVTGYPLEGSGGVDGAGYKDWAIDTLGIPSLTVEIGCQDAPLALREIYSIFVRNYRVLPTIARWLQTA